MKQLDKWQWSTLILSAILVMAFSVFIYRYEPFKSGFEITDQLGGNIFPATILSTATTDANLIVPADSDYIGNPKSCIAIRLKNSYANSKLRIEVAETPFFSQSVSEFILPKAGKEYLVFPDIIWNYQALRDNNQAVPVSISVKAELNKKELPQRLKTISMRSINECPLGYVDDKMKFHDTGEFFAAYVNEEHPQIDKLLREALDTRIVSIVFLGIKVMHTSRRMWTNRSMHCGMCCKSGTLSIAPPPIPVFRPMWFIHSASVPWTMRWNPRR